MYLSVKTLKILINLKNISLNIGIRLKNDLLEIDLDSINVSKDEIRDILESYQNTKPIIV